MTLTLDAISLVGLVAAMALVALAFVGWWHERSALTARLFSLLALIGSWWTLMRALAMSELSNRHPAFYLASEIFSGFFGPVLFLVTLAYLGRARRPRWWWAPVLLCGAAGTLNVFLSAALVPGDVRRSSLEAFRSGAPVSTLPLVAYAPWFLPLQIAHTAQLYVFIVLSALLFVRETYRPDSLVEAFDARVLALIYTVAAVALTLTELVPLLEFGNAAPRVAPLLSVPFLVVVRRIMRRRVIEVRSLRADREAVLPYLPLPRFAETLRTLGGPARPPIEAAVIFSDIRSFTTISEALDPTVVVAWLDAFYSRMSREIIAEQGVVDKLMGDGILAVFGAPIPSDRPGDAAFRAALRMQRGLADLNRVRPIQAGVALRMGIGIHYGRLVAGTLGG